QHVVHKFQTLTQRHANRVRELEWSRSGPAFFAVDRDKVGCDPGMNHRLADRGELAWAPHTQLEANRLSTRQFSQQPDELAELDRIAKGAVRGRGDHIFADLNSPNLSDLGVDFGARQYPSM